jgi:hypothetical protein
MYYVRASFGRRHPLTLEAQLESSADDIETTFALGSSRLIVASLHRLKMRMQQTFASEH